MNPDSDRKTTLGRTTSGKLPQGQLPTRATTPPIITHQDNYPMPLRLLPTRTTTPIGPLPLWDNYYQGQSPLLIGQLPPRTIAPKGKLLSIISTAPPSLTGNRDKYFWFVGIIEMVEKEGHTFSLLSSSVFSKVSY